MLARLWYKKNAYSNAVPPVLHCCFLQINASDAILIFDEAHNIEDQARCVCWV